MTGLARVGLAIGALLAKLPWQARIAVCLLASALSCVAIWWFFRHGWPNYPKINWPADKIQITVFFVAPWGLLYAIVAAFYRNAPQTETTMTSSDRRADAGSEGGTETSADEDKRFLQTAKAVEVSDETSDFEGDLSGILKKQKP